MDQLGHLLEKGWAPPLTAPTGPHGAGWAGAPDTLMPSPLGVGWGERAMSGSQTHLEGQIGRIGRCWERVGSRTDL